MQRLNINAAIAANQVATDRQLIKDLRETANLINAITKSQRKSTRLHVPGEQLAYKAGHHYTRAELLKRNYAIRNQLIDRGYFISEIKNIPKLFN